MLRILIFFLISFRLFAQDYDEIKGNVISRPERFASRYFIRNTLIEIFGKEASEVIDKNYFKAGKQVGGPCDIYEQVYHDHDKMVDPTRECPGGKPASKFPMFPDSNILRSSHMMKTCYELVYKGPFAKRLLREKKFEETLSQSFYPYGGDEKLKGILKKSLLSKDEEERRKALLTYCLSPGWQTL